MFESETVQVALITASSGVLGALLGACGAIAGPWWVKRIELDIERQRNDHEIRRRAIVDFANKKLKSMHAYHQVFSLGGKDDTLMQKIDDANESAKELYSLIRKEDAEVKNWINGMGFTALALKPRSVDDIITADAFLSTGVQYILSWHTGELRTNDLKPFGLDSGHKPIWLPSWTTEWPK